MILFFKFLLVFSLFFSSDRVLAVVGNKAILQSSVDEQASAFLHSVGGGEDELDSLKKNILAYLIEQEVLIYFAKKDTLLEVAPSQIDAVVGERLLFFKEQLGSTEALENYFGLTSRQIKEQLEEEARGVFLSDLFKRKLMSYISVSKEDVVLFYSTYKDSLPLTPRLYSYSCFHKNLLSSGASLRRAEEQAFEVFSSISSGASFDSFYSSFSGGELNYFRRGTFVQEFEEVAFSLKKGEIGGPVLSPLGFHIIRLNDRLGEKINASHILFEIKETQEDLSFLEKELIALRSSCFQKGPAFCDSLLKEDSFSGGGFSGVFSVVPENLINSEVLRVLNKSPLKVYSEIHQLEDNSFLFVRKDSLIAPSSPNLYEYWGFIEGAALEKKFNSFLKDWYKQNKKKVYIKVFN